MGRSLTHLAGKWDADRASYMPACGWPVPVRKLTRIPESVTCLSCIRSKVFQQAISGVEDAAEEVELTLPGRRYEPDF